MSGLEDTLLMQIRALGLPEPEREVVFARPRRWRFDFLFRRQKLAVEVEGGHWRQGRHQRPQGFEDDCVKYSEAAILGYRVIRVTSTMIEDGRALDLIERAIGKMPPPASAGARVGN